MNAAATAIAQASPRTPLSRAARCLSAAAACLALGACAAPPPPQTSLDVSDGAYARAFYAARDVLRDAQFELERVDARAGIITTAPRSWSGAATPWLPYATDLDSALTALGHRERLVVRVAFVPAEVPPAPGAADPTLIQPAVPLAADMREHTGSVRADVDVRVDRVYRPGRRVEPTAIRLSHFATDPALVEEGLQPTYAVPHREDDRLAERLARAIEQAISERQLEISDDPATGPETP